MSSTYFPLSRQKTCSGKCCTADGAIFIVIPLVPTNSKVWGELDAAPAKLELVWHPTLQVKKERARAIWTEI